MRKLSAVEKIVFNALRKISEKGTWFVTYLYPIPITGGGRLSQRHTLYFLCDPGPLESASKKLKGSTG
jgi:hypothetical protein